MTNPKETICRLKLVDDRRFGHVRLGGPVRLGLMKSHVLRHAQAEPGCAFGTAPPASGRAFCSGDQPELWNIQQERARSALPAYVLCSSGLATPLHKQMLPVRVQPTNQHARGCSPPSHGPDSTPLSLRKVTRDVCLWFP